MTILIGNLRQGMPDWSDGRNVYVGRAFAGLEASPLQNPFTIGRDGDRHEVCQKYLKYITSEFNKSHANEIQFAIWDIWAELEQSETLTLWCWCAPEECHAEIIRDILEG